MGIKAPGPGGFSMAFFSFSFFPEMLGSIKRGNYGRFQGVS